MAITIKINVSVECIWNELQCIKSIPTFITRMIFNLLLLFVHMCVRAIGVCVEGIHDKLLVWNSERLYKLSSLMDAGIELRLWDWVTMPAPRERFVAVRLLLINLQFISIEYGILPSLVHKSQHVWTSAGETGRLTKDRLLSFCSSKSNGPVSSSAL